MDTRSKAHSAVAIIANTEGWLLDSAASFHMSKVELSDINKERGGERVKIANKEMLTCVGIGQAVVGGQVELKEVRYVPGLDMNLMSISALCRDG